MAQQVVPKKLCELHPETTNALITALVITKTEPNFFMARDSGEQRGVMTFTLRDTRRHIVNCKFWGSKEKVEDYNRKLKISNVIDVINPKVQALVTHSTDQYGDQFQPKPTLPIALVVNEGEGLLNEHDYHDVSLERELRKLWNVSHKPLCAVLNLADVRFSGVGAAEKRPQAQFTDLFVAVALLRPTRELKSTRKIGQMLNCLEVIVFDASYTGGMVLTIWNIEWIRRAEENWKNMKTLLHLIDVKISYSEFHKSTTLNMTSRTIIYENPEGEEAKKLADFASTTTTKPFDIFAQSSSSGNLPLPEQIITQMTVKQIYERAEGNLKDQTEQFTAVLYGMVTKFDIDGQNLTVSQKCKSCHRLLLKNKTVCETDQCQLAFSMNDSSDQFENFFNINIQFSDHTGTLVEARISGGVAEQVLGIKVEEFLRMSDEEKEALKWRFLMEYFEVKLLIKKPTPMRNSLIIIVVNMEAVDLATISQKMLTF